MKVNPANQTLILAGEARGRLAVAASLQRVTLVYVQADYAPHAPVPVLARRTAPQALGNADGLSAHLTPVELYARTQRLNAATTQGLYLDVHA